MAVKCQWHVKAERNDSAGCFPRRGAMCGFPFSILFNLKKQERKKERKKLRKKEKRDCFSSRVKEITCE